MWLRARSFVLVGLCLHLQLNVWAEKQPENFSEENDGSFQLQKCVERLIEKILRFVENFYAKIRNKDKCIPEEVPDTIIEILKRSIDCVGSNEKRLQDPRMTKGMTRKILRGCLSRGKKEVQDLMNGIDLTLNYCPENMTEKTYQINVTTSIMKIFNINIKNGLEITREMIYFKNRTVYRDDKEGEQESEAEPGTEEFDGSEYSDYYPHKYYEEEEYAYDEPGRKTRSKIVNVPKPLKIGVTETLE